MAVIGVVSAKGSPGVSTLAMQLVQRWPRQVVGIELDPSGGSWALRHDLSWEPGLVSFAATPSAVTFDAALEHGARVGRHGAVVCASPFADQVRASLGLVADRLSLWPDDLDVIVDVGRYDDMAAAVLRRCLVTLVVTRTRVEDVGQLARLADTLRGGGMDARMVAVGAEDYPSADIASEVKLPLVDVAVPFARRSRALDRAYALLADVVAGHVAVGSVSAGTRDGFVAGLDRAGWVS